MIPIKKFVNELKKNDLKFASGVPDSLLKDLCFEFENIYKSKHISAPNEGVAVSLGVGYNLKTNRIPIIYLQNSGFGNAINPLISIADKRVFKIPLFLIMGWRGETGKMITDEPQHQSQGEITTFLLRSLKIKYIIIDKKSNFKNDIKKLKNYSKKNHIPVCLLVRKNAFEKKNNNIKLNQKLIIREKFLEFLVNFLPENSIIITTTGVISREVYDILKLTKKKMKHFMCVGGMGHAVSIATGIAHNSKKKVYCLDGDGSIGMHMGSLSVSSKQKNLIHILLNNFSHESVGGHDTATKDLNFSRLAKVIGYEFSKRCTNISSLNKIMHSLKKKTKSSFIEILCNKGHRKNVSRPKENLIHLKEQFKKNL